MVELLVIYCVNVINTYKQLEAITTFIGIFFLGMGGGFGDSGVADIFGVEVLLLVSSGSALFFFILGK